MKFISGFSNFPRFSFIYLRFFFSMRSFNLNFNQILWQVILLFRFFILIFQNHWEIQFKIFKIFYKSWLFLVYLTTSLKIPMQTNKKSQNNKFGIFIESRKRDLFIVTILIIHRRCSSKTKRIGLGKIASSRSKFSYSNKEFPIECHEYLLRIPLLFLCILKLFSLNPILSFLRN